MHLKTQRAGRKKPDISPSPRGPEARAAVRAAPLPPVEWSRAEHAIARMAQLLPMAGSVAEAQRRQLAVIHRLLEPKACYVAQFLPSKNMLRVATARGRNDARIMAVTPGEGPAGRAFAERRIVREEGVVAAPLLGDAPLGCLVVVSPRHEASDHLIAALAAQIAAGWEFARLQDESTRRNKDLQTAVAGLKGLEKSREDLLSHVSHDLKNPLTTIKAYLTMVMREKLGEVTERQQRALQACDRSADRLLRMINDLLLISRLRSGKMELNERPFGFKAVAEETLVALTPLAEQAKVRLRLERSPEVFVRGDRERICEAAYHLLENAIHASSAEGEVVVSVDTGASGLAVLSVRDAGTGIAEEELRHLFDTYYRPRAGPGTVHTRGLGLPIVAKIVNLHGGRVEVSSKVGAGSTFQIHLPMFAGAVSPLEPLPERRAEGILLVEDDADCRQVVQQVLEGEGYRVIAASGAAEARALLGQVRPGLVLLDLHLRDEEGRAVLHFIRETEALAEVPVYIISGSSEVGSLGRGVGKDRIDGFFEKPLNLPKLLDTVASVVQPSLSPVARSP